MVDVSVVDVQDGLAPGLLGQRVWEAGLHARVVVLPALPTEPAGPVTDLHGVLERSAELRDKLVRNLTGSTCLVVTAIAEYGVHGPGLVGIVLSADGVEARGFAYDTGRGEAWMQTFGAEPARFAITDELTLVVALGHEVEAAQGELVVAVPERT